MVGREKRGLGFASLVGVCLTAVVAAGCCGGPLRRCLGRYGAGDGRFALGRGPLLGGPAHAATGYCNQPRFFPVPARPVFLPRPDVAAVAGRGLYPGEGELHPPGPDLELIPAPDAAEGEHVEMPNPNQNSQVREPAKWIFRPAAGETPAPSVAPLVRLGLRKEGGRR